MQTNNYTPDYILNLDHKFPFEQFGKKWVMYLPGFEGLYAISEDCCICSLDRVCFTSNGQTRNYKAKLLKSVRIDDKVNTLGAIVYNIGAKSFRKTFTKKMLLDINSSVQNEFKEKIEFNFPFKYENKNWIGYLKLDDKTEVKDYLISDDVFVLSVNKFISDELINKFKVLKWTKVQNRERIQIKTKHPNGIKKLFYINRKDVLNLVSKILETISDD